MSIVKLRALGLVLLILLSSVSGTAVEVGQQSAANSDTSDDPVVYLVVNKTVSSLTDSNVDHVSVTRGEIVTFNVTILNDGVDGANVTVIDSLPDGFEFLSAEATNGSYNAASGEWTLEVRPRGRLEILEIRARATESGEWENLAEVVESDPEHIGESEFRSDTATVTVIDESKRTDLSITKEANESTISRDQPVTFNISVTNNGPNNTTNVSVHDELPSGLVFQSAIASQGTYEPFTGNWTVGDLTVGEEANLSVTVAGELVGTWDNTATINSTDINDLDSSNNRASSTVIVETQPTPDEKADLDISKTSNADTSSPGDEVTFVIDLRNDGPDRASGVAVIDRLPQGFEILTNTTSQGSFNASSGIWTVGDLPAGANETLLITAIANQSGSWDNIAEVTASDQFDPDSTPDNNDPNEDDWDNATVEVRSNVDLAVTKKAINGTTTADRVTAMPGDDIKFRLTVKNTGPDDATGVELTDVIPTGITDVSNSSSQGSFSGHIWNVGTVENGSQAQLLILGNISKNEQSGTTIENVGYVSELDQDDSNAVNDEDRASVLVIGGPQPQTADLSISKTVDKSTATLGERARFVITVSNNGVNTSTGILINDTLPPGLSYDSHSTTKGTYNRSSGEWTISDLGVSDNETLTLSANATQTGTWVNLANITASSVADPVLGNNGASATVIVEGEPTEHGADLTLTKSVNDTTFTIGEGALFNVSVENSGPEEATDVVVKDSIPSGFDFVSTTPSAAVTFFSGNRTVVWHVGSLKSGDSQHLTIRTSAVLDGTWTNTAEATSTVTDLNPANNQDSVSVDVRQRTVDLQVTKQGPATIRPHEELVYTVTVTNAGPDQATNVEVEDPVPFALSATPSKGTYRNPNWNVGTLNASETATLTLRISLPDGIPDGWIISNEAFISHSDQLDQTPENNQAIVETTVVSEADLAIEKSVDRSTAAPGEIVEFTVNVTNNGPSTAVYFEVEDRLDPKLQLIEAKANQGSYSSGFWYLGTLDSGASASLTLRTVISPTAAIGDRLDNIATVVPTGPQNDPNLGNNQATATVTVGEPPGADLSISKSVSNTSSIDVEHVSTSVGENVTYSVTVSNQGPGPASKIIVTDVADNLLPGGEWDFEPLASETSQGSWSWTGSSGKWIVGSLPSGDRATLNVTGRYQRRPEETMPEGTLRNRAEVSSANDPNPANNGDAANVTVYNGTADLVVNKTVQNVTLNPDTGSTSISPRSDTVTQFRGSDVIFTVNVTNAGPDNATGILLNDTPPAGLEPMPWWSTSTGTFDPISWDWEIDRLESGERASLTFGAVVNDTGTLENEAVIASSDQRDLTSSNDRDTATVQGIEPPVSNVTIEKTVANETVTDEDRVHAGLNENVTYTITVSNTGNSSENLFVYDPVLTLLTEEEVFTGADLTIDGRPPFEELSNETTQGDWNESDGPNRPSRRPSPRIWDVGELDPGENATLTVKGRFTEASLFLSLLDMNPVRNFALVASNDGEFIGMDEASVSVGDRADLTVEKTVSNSSVSDAQHVTTWVGEDHPVNYTIRLSNNGPENATLVYGFDPILGMLSQNNTLLNNTAVYVERSNTTSQGTWTRQSTLPILGRSGVGVWELGSLENGSTATLQINGHYNEALWRLITRPLELENRAIVLGTIAPRSDEDPFDPFDPLGGRSQSSLISDTAAVTFVPQADIGVDKTVSTTTAAPSDNVTVAIDENVTYSVSITSDTPTSSTVVVDDPMLAILMNESNSAFQVSNVTQDGTWTRFSEGSGVWYVDLGENGTNAAMSVTGAFQTDQPAPVRNSVTVETPSSTDPNPANNKDSATVTVQRTADLSLTKEANVSAVTTGDPVGFTIEVTNDGPNNATGVVVSDSLPARYDFVNVTPTQGSYDTNRSEWVVGEIAVNDTAVLNLTAEANTSSNTTLRNVAEIAESDAADPDSIPGNGERVGEDDWDEARVDVTAPPLPPSNESADLDLIKVANRTTVQSGETVRFTLRIGNEGPNATDGVAVIDDLPSRFTLLSASATQGFYDLEDGIWTVGSVAVGQEGETPPTLDLTVRVDAPNGTSIENTAEISESDLRDPDSVPGNGLRTEDDFATVNVTVSTGPAPPEETADLELTKTANTETVTLGNTVTFNVSIRNVGPSPTSGVIVNDVLPSGLSHVSSSATRGSYSPNSGDWRVRSEEIDGFDVGDNATLTVTVNATQSGTWTNSANITMSDVLDPDLTDNRDNVTVTVKAAPGPTPPDDDGDGGGDGGGVQANVTLISATPNETEVTVGDTVRINGTVENTGFVPGRIEVGTLVNETYVGENKSRSVPARESRIIEFDVAFDSPGTFAVWLIDIESGRMVSAGNITVEPPPTPTPTGTSTQSPTETAEPARVTIEEATPESTPAPVEEPAGFNFWWILVLVLILLGILGAREYVRRSG